MSPREQRLREKIDELRDQLHEERARAAAAKARLTRTTRRLAHARHAAELSAEQLERTRWELANRNALEREENLRETFAAFGGNDTDWATFRRVLDACTPCSTIDTVDHAALVTITVLNTRQEAVQ